MQLVLEGVPSRKPKHQGGSDTVGADGGPSTIALVPQQAAASLEVFCEALVAHEKEVRRLPRQMDRQRRAANPDNSDEQGRIKKQGQKKLHGKACRTDEKTRGRKATTERKLAAHRKSLHGKNVHAIVAVGNTVMLEKLSDQAWQKQ